MVTERIAAPAAAAAHAAGPVGSAVPRRAAGDAHGPAAAPAPASARSEADAPGRGTPDPSGVSGSLIDVFA